MPGYEMSRDQYGKPVLNLGKVRPTPSAVPSGGFDGPLAPHLAAMAARQRGQQGQAQAQATGLLQAPPAQPPQPSPHELAMLNYGRSGPMQVGARSNLHAFGDTGFGTQDLYGRSGAAAYGQGLVSAQHRNLLERNIENEQANYHGALHAALTGQPAAPFEAMVGGSHPTSQQVASYNHAFPSAARANPSPVTPGGLLAGGGGSQPPAPPVPHPPTIAAPAIPFGPDVTPEAIAALPTRPGLAAVASPSPASPPPTIAAAAPAPAMAPASAPAADPAYAAEVRWASGQSDPNMRNALLAQAEINRAERARTAEMHSAQLAGLTAEAEGRRLTNQGLPSQNRIAAAQAAQTEQATGLGPTGRQIVSGVGAGVFTPQQGREEEARAAIPAPRPGMPPTFDSARAALFGPSGMMGVDPERISPTQGGDPLGDYMRALDNGHDLSDPNSPLSDHFQAYLRGKYGSDAYSQAGWDPHYLFSTPSLRERNAARWFRDQPGIRPPVQVPTAPRVPAPPRPQSLRVERFY